jgi:lactate dehydrogenase-like 2-hydroxyacid dehydrogenase
MNIVMVDSGQLTGDPDFPEINLPKFGWSQFVALKSEEIDERCWRADIIVSTNTPINAEVIKESFKLKLIIAAGDKTDHIDKAAANERGIIICNVPGLTGDSSQNAQKIANQVVDNINRWLDEQPVNVVA